MKRLGVERAYKGGPLVKPTADSGGTVVVDVDPHQSPAARQVEADLFARALRGETISAVIRPDGTTVEGAEED